MKYSRLEVKKLLRCPEVSSADKDIADAIGCSIFHENEDSLVQFLIEELEASLLNLNKITSYLKNNTTQLISFSKKILEKESPEQKITTKTKYRVTLLISFSIVDFINYTYFNHQ